MPVIATKANAETIEAELGLAVASLIDAERHLRAALTSAERDYDGNDVNVKNILGATSLASSAAAVERGIWAKYYAAR